MAFDPTDDTSAMGVTINMADAFEIFCGVNGSTCFEGRADCRISASIYNKHMMISESNKFVPTMSRHSGVVYSPEAVENQLAKCSYAYDGSSDQKLNGGCGCGALGPAGAGACDDVMSAYFNHDCAWSATFDADACRNACRASDSTGACLQATPQTEKVEPCWCSSGHLANVWPNYDQNAAEGQDQCYFKGPAFYPGSGEQETRAMLKRRFESQQTNGSIQQNDLSANISVYKPEKWNEIVLDGKVAFDMLNTNPESVVIAFVYQKDDTPGLNFAQAMQTQFLEQYSVTIPLVAFDTHVDVSTTPPFVFIETLPVTV